VLYLPGAVDAIFGKGMADKLYE